MKTNVKGILFKVDLAGRGIVNMDSSDQKWFYNNEEKSIKKNRNDNVLYSKKNFYRGKENELIEKVKISRDCFLKGTFNNDIIANSPNIMYNPNIMYTFLASPVSLLRGWLLASKGKTLKRKGAVTMSDVEQTNNAIPTIEKFSRAQEKTTNTDDEKADNTLFYKETVGDMTYSATGMVDLSALQLLSCDQTLDRFSFDPDEFNHFSPALQRTLPNTPMELRYWQYSTSAIRIPERGLKVVDSDIVELVKVFLTKLLTTSITRRDAFANVTGLKVKLVSDPLTDTVNNEEGWITLGTKEDIDNISFGVANFYDEVSEDYAKELKEEFEAKQRLAKLADKERKEQAKKKKDAKKKEAEVEAVSGNEDETGNVTNDPIG